MENNHLHRAEDFNRLMLCLGIILKHILKHSKNVHLGAKENCLAVVRGNIMIQAQFFKNVQKEQTSRIRIHAVFSGYLEYELKIRLLIRPDNTFSMSSGRPGDSQG